MTQGAVSYTRSQVTQKGQHYSEVQREGVLERKRLLLHRSLCRRGADAVVTLSPSVLVMFQQEKGRFLYFVLSEK